MHFVYILFSKSKDRCYFGETAEPARRLAQHNRGNVPSTKYGIPWTVAWATQIENRQLALQLEKKLKNLHSRKRVIHFINKHPPNPEILALFESADNQGTP
jgi:putative endonuclease